MIERDPETSGETKSGETEDGKEGEASFNRFWDTQMKLSQFAKRDVTGKRRERFRVFMSQGRVLCLLSLAGKATYPLIWTPC